MARPLLLKRHRAITLFAAVLICSGVYFILVALFPFTSSTFVSPDTNATVQRLATSKENITENRLYIPKIDINLPYARGDDTVMERGAWWRAPGSGNPKDGGNFVLSAHRFVMGWTPGETVKRSPFYNIDKLANGDVITIDYEGERYVYEISQKYSVPPTAIEIEGPTNDNRLTLYSCELGGASDLRDVIVATLKT